jgi:two-component system response regulator AtoC
MLSRTSFYERKSEVGRSNSHDSGEPPRFRLKEISREAALAAEREAISQVLGHTRWNRLRAAKLLNISYRALLYKIKQVGLEPRTAPLDGT